MKLSLRHEHGHVRVGWKILFFVLASVASFVVVGVVGHRLPESLKAFAPSAILIAVLGLAVSWGATRMEGTTLSSIGWRLDGRFARQFGLGIGIGMAMIAASAAAVCGLAGVHLVPIAGPTMAVHAKLVATFLGGAIFEELLFRGYAFQRAARAMGVGPAIAVFSLLFCLGHVPGNLEVGAALLTTAMLDIFLDGVCQSLLVLRTQSLALAIGLHFGWNWLQESLGFGVSGISATHAWFRVDLGQQAGWLTGGEFGLEASVFALVVQVALVGVLVARPLPRTGLVARGA